MAAQFISHFHFVMKAQADGDPWPPDGPICTSHRLPGWPGWALEETLVNRTYIIAGSMSLDS